MGDLLPHGRGMAFGLKCGVRQTSIHMDGDKSCWFETPTDHQRRELEWIERTLVRGLPGVEPVSRPKARVLEVDEHDCAGHPRSIQRARWGGERITPPVRANPDGGEQYTYVIPLFGRIKRFHESISPVGHRTQKSAVLLSRVRGEAHTPTSPLDRATPEAAGRGRLRWSLHALRRRRAASQPPRALKSASHSSSAPPCSARLATTEVVQAQGPLFGRLRLG